MPRNLRGSVVVITGAPSGINRTNALAFARQGANVVVAARRPAPLDELVHECEGLGTQALAVPTDVTNQQAVQALPPVYPPERVAETVVRLAQSPRREALVGTVSPQTRLQQILAPGRAPAGAHGRHPTLSGSASCGHARQPV